VCFFSTKAFLILAIVIVKIVYLGFLVSYTSRVALIMQISRVLSLFGSSIVSYVVSFLGLGLVLGTELVLDLGLGSLSILFIVRSSGKILPAFLQHLAAFGGQMRIPRTITCSV
jgi:hypothetical protein